MYLSPFQIHFYVVFPYNFSESRGLFFSTSKILQKNCRINTPPAVYPGFNESWSMGYLPNSCVHDQWIWLMSERAPCSAVVESATYGSWSEYLVWVVRDPRQEPNPFGFVSKARCCGALVKCVFSVCVSLVCLRCWSNRPWDWAHFANCLYRCLVRAQLDESGCELLF